MEFDITGNVILNTQQAKQDLNSLFLDGSSQSMIATATGNSIINGAQYQQTNEKTNQLNDAFGNLKDQMEKVLESFKSLCVSLDDTANKAGVDFTKIRKDQTVNSITPTTNNKNSPTATNGVNQLVSIANNGSNIASSVASGNISGAMIGGVSSTGSALMSGAGNLATMGLSSIAGPLMAVGGVILAGAAAMKGADAFAQKYEDALPGMDKLLSTFGGDNIGEFEREANANKALELRNLTSEGRRGTGLDNEAYISLISSLGSYGVNNIDRANEIAHKSGVLASYTNTDPNKILNFGGLVERYGGNATQAMDNAFKSARASGLDKAQFGEFLDGLSRVIENGISKGFINSTEEVASNLGMLSKLSNDNPLWMGKEGANKYMTMMNSVSSKTDLQSASSVLLGRTAYELGVKSGADFYKNNLGEGGYLEGDSMLNTLAYIEKGNLNQDFMGAYRDKLKQTYGGDVESQVANLKETYGLNWAGSIQLYNMMQKIGTAGYTEADFNKDKDSIMENPEYESDNKHMIDILSDINTEVVNIGKPLHNLKFEGLDDIKNLLEPMAAAVIGNSYENYAKSAANKLFSAGESVEKGDFVNLLMNDLTSDDPQKIRNAMNLIKWVNNQDEWTLRYYDDTNTPLDLFDPQKRIAHPEQARAYTDVSVNEHGVLANTITEPEFANEFSLNERYYKGTAGERLMHEAFTLYQDNPDNYPSDYYANLIRIAQNHKLDGYSRTTGMSFDEGLLNELKEYLRQIENNTRDSEVTITMPTASNPYAYAQNQINQHYANGH